VTGLIAIQLDFLNRKRTETATIERREENMEKGALKTKKGGMGSEESHAWGETGGLLPRGGWARPLAQKREKNVQGKRRGTCAWAPVRSGA